MSKIMIWVVIGVVVVVGGYSLISNSKLSEKNEEVVNSTLSEPTEEATSGKKMAFSEFIKNGGSYKCTVNQSVNGTDTVGTTYIDGGMIRGEYNTKVQNLNVDSTLIVRDGYTYTWTSMTPNMGFKAKVVESIGGDIDAGMSGQYSFNAEQIGDYNCEAWSSDASKFALPAGVTFNELAY